MQQFVPQSLPSCSLVCVPPSMTGEVWPVVDGLITAAYERNGLTVPPMAEQMLAHGTLLLWLAIDPEYRVLCATTTALTDRGDDGMVCEIRACGGARMREWLPFYLELERYARGEGCAKVRLRGRKGWLRVLPGFSRVDDVMEKVL